MKKIVSHKINDLPLCLQHLAICQYYFAFGRKLQHNKEESKRGGSFLWRTNHYERGKIFQTRPKTNLFTMCLSVTPDMLRLIDNEIHYIASE